MSNLFNHKYPYTDFHELNLDYLLNHYQDLVDRLNEINTWISKHEIEYEAAIAELNRLANEIDTFEAQINERFEILARDQQKQLDDAIAGINLEVDTKISQLTSAVQSAIDAMNAQVEQLKLDVNNEIASFKAQVNREIVEIRNEVRANNDYVFAWVENRLQQFIDSLPEILTVYVYNPYRGEVTDIQTAIYDIYSYSSVYGLTAKEYDDLGLTAKDYDDLNLTALQYDMYGYKYLFKDPNVYMYSPFTGEYVPVKDVVYKLAQFHMDGLTAEGYDDKNLTADDYDNLNLSAFDYDWFANQLIA